MQPGEAPIKQLAMIAGVLLATVALAITVALSMLHVMHVRPGGPGLPDAALLQIDGPALQSAPQLDLQAWQAAQQHQLNSTGWINEQAGVAHIPIDQAMTLLARQGLRAAMSGPLISSSPSSKVTTPSSTTTGTMVAPAHIEDANGRVPPLPVGSVR